MRRTVLSLACLTTMTLVLAMLPAANADHCDEGECACPTYNHQVGLSRTSVAWNDDRQALVTLGDSPEQAVQYVTVDALFMLTPHGDESSFIIFVYPESNGMDGLQRNDEYCSNCDWADGCHPDALLP